MVILRRLLFSAIFSPLLINSNAWAETTRTCASQVDFSVCECVGPPVGCIGAIAACHAVTTTFNECIANLPVTSRHLAKFNLFASDYNFLEIINLNPNEKLTGYFRIRTEDSFEVGHETEFEINAAGRMDFDIHSAVNAKRFGIIEIIATSDNNQILSYVSYYNQREQATSSGTTLDQTITVQAVAAP